ncbi:MAG: succinate dehydrogenase [Burkholderiaceae bacterium]
MTRDLHWETRLWLAQRVSAAVLAFCVIVHLITIIYATRGGLSGAEILARTRGNTAWLAFYVVFVLAVAVHVPIGLRAIAAEWLGWTGAMREVVLAAFGVALAVMGFRAAWAVFA